MVRNRIFEAFLVFIIAMLFWKSCQVIKEKEELANQISSYKIGEKEFKNKILADSSTLATQTQTILTQDQAIATGILKLEGQIKKVQSQVREMQRIIIDSVMIPYIPDNYADTSVWMKKIKEGQVSKALMDSLLNNSVIVPKQFKLENKWYDMYGKVKKDGVLMDSIKIENESSITVGWKNAGFLGLKKEAVVEIKNTNPYLSVTKMNNVVIEKKKGVFQSKIFWMGIGIFGGLMLNKL